MKPKSLKETLSATHERARIRFLSDYGGYSREYRDALAADTGARAAGRTRLAIPNPAIPLDPKAA